MALINKEQLSLNIAGNVFINKFHRSLTYEIWKIKKNSYQALRIIELQRTENIALI